ncbi:hypothetical protein [Microlunatus antarcticus]|uniref:WD40-like Beta Propeller Repeat n=1 Tax=Microlunatus antarcticus TaxID=53388 RepID=A0A7W5JVM1_9ACTN|nr:hypothetical protein [Microlunatus antarcticus]MBB3326861.1 hypothetical protein [Microlunatus antarcticus]
MATSGRSRPLVVGLTVLLLAGCSAPTTPARPGASATAPATAATPATSPGPTTAPATVSAEEPCRVELPARWQAALDDGVVDPAKGETLTVALGAADGTTFLVSTVKGEQHVLEWRRGDERGVVQDLGLDHPEWQVLGATWDGRYLAYRVDQSYSSFEDFSLYVWDSRSTAKPVRVAHGEPDRHGDLMQTPFVDPVLADGWLYWTQTRDADPEHTVLSGYRLEDGRTVRLSKGYGRAPVRFGDDLVWADSDGPGKTSTLRMLDLATHEPAEVPAALAGVRGPYYLAGDADTLTWVGGAKGREVDVWRAGWPEPRRLLEADDSPQLPRIAGDVVVYAADDAMYAADLRSWSSAQVTPTYGGIYADGGPVVTVGFAPASKDRGSVQTLLDTDAVGPLGRTGC